MKANVIYLSLFLMIFMMSCNKESSQLQVQVYETSENGNKLTKLDDFSESSDSEIVSIELEPDSTFQTITGWWIFYRVFCLFTKSIK